MASTARQVMAESPQARQALLTRLRADIKKVQAAPRKLVMGLSCGVAELDELGLFRLGAAVELCGEEASGRTSLALRVVASACREKRLSAWVDGPAELYPPAAEPLGVELSRLLIVRPKAPGQIVWSAVQLLRSGAFASVVLDVTHTGLKLNMLDARKLIDAARAGGAVLVVLTGQAAPAQGMIRLQCGGRVQPALGVVSGAGAGELPFTPSLSRAPGTTGGPPALRVVEEGGPGDSALQGHASGLPERSRGRTASRVPGGFELVLDSAQTERPGVPQGDQPAASAQVLPLTPSLSRSAGDPDVDDRGQLHLALVHGGGGTAVDVARQALCPRGRTRRATHVAWPGLALPAQSAEPGLQRPRRNLERDGYLPGGPKGLRHGRPGRDTKLVLPLAGDRSLQRLQRHG